MAYRSMGRNAPSPLVDPAGLAGASRFDDFHQAVAYVVERDAEQGYLVRVSLVVAVPHQGLAFGRGVLLLLLLLLLPLLRYCCCAVAVIVKRILSL